MKQFNPFYKNLIDYVYKVNDVSRGYFYHYNYLIDRVIDLLVYDDLPDTLPAREINKRLFMHGYAGFIDHPKFGKIVCDCSLTGWDVYKRYNKALFYNVVPGFLNRFIPNNKEIGKECEVVYCQDLEQYYDMNPIGKDNFSQMISRYARQLADLDATYNIELISDRQQYVVSTRNQQTFQSFVNFFKKLKNGDYFVGIDPEIIKDTVSLKLKENNPGLLTELLDNRERIMKAFWAELGIFTSDDKNERMIVDELKQENRNTKLFIYNVLKSVSEGIDRVNNLWGTNIKVYLNPALYNDNIDLDNIEITEEDIEIINPEEVIEEQKEEEVVNDEA